MVEETKRLTIFSYPPPAEDDAAEKVKAAEEAFFLRYKEFEEWREGSLKLAPFGEPPPSVRERMMGGTEWRVWPGAEERPEEATPIREQSEWGLEPAPPEPPIKVNWGSQDGGGSAREADWEPLREKIELFDKLKTVYTAVELSLMYPELWALLGEGLVKAAPYVGAAAPYAAIGAATTGWFFGMLYKAGKAAHVETEAERKERIERETRLYGGEVIKVDAAGFPTVIRLASGEIVNVGSAGRSTVTGVAGSTVIKAWPPGYAPEAVPPSMGKVKALYDGNSPNPGPNKNPLKAPGNPGTPGVNPLGAFTPGESLGWLGESGGDVSVEFSGGLTKTVPAAEIIRYLGGGATAATSDFFQRIKNVTIKTDDRLDEGRLKALLESLMESEAATLA
jgi:hypothetical protein